MNSILNLIDMAWEVWWASRVIFEGGVTRLCECLPVFGFNSFFPSDFCLFYLYERYTLILNRKYIFHLTGWERKIWNSIFTIVFGFEWIFLKYLWIWNCWWIYLNTNIYHNHSTTIHINQSFSQKFLQSNHNFSPQLTSIQISIH